MSEETGRSESIRKLAEMIKDIEFAMLTTVDDDGSLRSRPMATQHTEFDGELYFFTHASAPKVGEIEREHHVNLSYAKPEDQRYVSISGTARVLRDRQKIEELWSPELKAWFPEGQDDPDIALLCVRVERAEYWDSTSSAMAHLLGFVKAVATGTTYQPGENEKINLQ